MTKGAYKFMNSEQIRLGQRIIDFEDLREIIKGLMGAFQSESSLFLETPGGINSHWDAGTVVLAFSHGFHVFEVTESPSKQLQKLGKELACGDMWPYLRCKD